MVRDLKFPSLLAVRADRFFHGCKLALHYYYTFKARRRPACLLALPPSRAPLALVSRLHADSTATIYVRVAKAGAPCLPAESSPPASCTNTRSPMIVSSRKSASATLCCRTKEKPAFSASLWDRQSPQTLAAVVTASWRRVNASNRRRAVRWSSDIAHARGTATYALSRYGYLVGRKSHDATHSVCRGRG